MNANPIDQHARRHPAASITLRCPNRATRGRDNRAPITPPAQGKGVDHDRVEEQRAQHRVGEDVAPALEHVSGAQPRRAGLRRARLAATDGSDRDRREQKTDGIRDHRDHRTEQREDSPTKRRTEDGGRPGRLFEPRIGGEQFTLRRQRLEIRTARRAESNVGSTSDDGHDEKLCEAEPTESKGDRDARQCCEPDEVGGDHRRTLAAVLQQRRDRHGHDGPHRQSHR
jgi:hypothetical protein